jgi:predicted glycoside hydrolase/deacetylase ChbG (UPF0249 family)
MLPRQSLVAVLLALALASAGAGEADAIRLIIMADDLGAAQAVNQGTFEALREGVATTTNVIAPGPWFLQAARLAAENPTVEVGVHLALTSEWSDVKWRPLTGGRSFTDPDGYLAPFVWPNPLVAPGRSLRELKVDLVEVEAELRAQIELARRHIPRVCYLWAHMGFPGHSPEMLALVRKLAQETGIALFSDVSEQLGIKSLKAGYDRYASGEQKAAALVKAIAALTPGTWVMVDHAAIDSPEMRSIGHKGYENVAADRNANRLMWIDPSVRAAIIQRGVKLIGTAEVIAEWRAKQGATGK